MSTPLPASTLPIEQKVHTEMPYVITSTYYKHGDEAITICLNRTAFLKEVKAHVKELAEHESYDLDLDVPEAIWINKLLVDSKRIMIDGQAGYGWTAVIHGAEIYHDNINMSVVK